MTSATIISTSVLAEWNFCFRLVPHSFLILIIKHIFGRLESKISNFNLINIRILVYWKEIKKCKCSCASIKSSFSASYFHYYYSVTERQLVCLFPNIWTVKNYWNKNFEVTINFVTHDWLRRVLVILFSVNVNKFTY